MYLLRFTFFSDEIAVSLDGIQYGSVNASGLNDKEVYLGSVFITIMEYVFLK